MPREPCALSPEDSFIVYYIYNIFRADTFQSSTTDIDQVLSKNSFQHLFLLFVFSVSLLFFRGCSEKDLSGLPVHVAEAENLILLDEKGERETEFHFERDLAFDDSLFFDRITDLRVDNSGRLFMAGKSWNRRQVHTFNPDGTYGDSLGNFGTGLGEFRSIDRIQIKGDTLFLIDQKLSRITTFDLERNSWIDTTGYREDQLTLPYELSASEYTAAPVYVFDDSRTLISFTKNRNPAYEPEGRIRYYLTESDGRVTDRQILEQKDLQYLVGDYAGRPAPFTLPLPEKPLMAVSGSGVIISAQTEEFFIRVMDVENNRESAYYIDYERRILDPNDVIHPRFSHNDQLRRVKESAVYPEKWPALYSMIVDDQERIWVSTIIDDRNLLEWWVIDLRENRLITRFIWPFDKQITTVQNGSVYTIEKNTIFKNLPPAGQTVPFRFLSDTGFSILRKKLNSSILWRIEFYGLTMRLNSSKHILYFLKTRVLRLLPLPTGRMQFR